jgi:tRNA threonylcarbamoyl adenosine modification protein YeaZ
VTLILAWDTSTPVLSVALVKVDPTSKEAHETIFETIFQGEGDGVNTHSSVLPQLVSSLFKDLGISPCDLDLVAAGRGPGSFTGLRTGLAYAKGLGLGLGIPVLGIPSLEVLAYGDAVSPGLVAPVVDARHKEVFSALYLLSRGGSLTGLFPLTEILVLRPENFAKTLLEKAYKLPHLNFPGAALTPELSHNFSHYLSPPLAITVTGPGAALLPPMEKALLKGPLGPPDAVVLAKLAFQYYLGGKASDCLPLPLYGRSPQIFSSWVSPTRL